MQESLVNRPPAWVHALLGSTAAPAAAEDHEVDVIEGEHFSLVSTAAPCPLEISAEQLEHLARDLYLSILERIATLQTPYAVRVWNFIPGILQPVSDLAHRYMAFNAGRFRAYRRWFGEEFARQMPTASGVGNPDARLEIYALAAASPAPPVDNPRQFPSQCYSLRYGPYPPCFSRAVDLPLPDEGRWLLVGGTASVRGERTVHAAAFEPQADETFLNLATLVDVASGRNVTADRLSASELADRLDRYRSIRVYLPRASDEDRIGESISARFAQAHQIELLHTELCRPDLLIEIEGVAELDPTPSPN